MKLKQLILGIALTCSISAPAFAEELTGDTKLACEALLCLSSGVQPGECAPSLARYFSIVYKKWSDTLKGRINFLNLCPSASATGMPALVNDIANGAGLCDAATLNSRLQIVDENGTPQYIDNNLPAECAAYSANAYVRLNLQYTGPLPPAAGGYWENK